jgi:cytochrome c oxidase assembly factor CtaG
MWLPVLETLPAPAWFGSGSKLAYVLVVRLAGATLANVFLWWNTVLYPTYARAGERWGITPLGDQRIAGGLMLLEGSILTLAIIVWLFLRAFGEAGQRQELLERGLPVAAVHRAVRFGRGEKLSDLH